MSAVDDAINALGAGLALLPTGFNSPAARVQLIATGLQESRLIYRRQLGADGKPTGPAAGLLQMEQGGGVKGVLTNPQSRSFAAQACTARQVLAEPLAVWQRLQTDDILAFAFGRLILFCDPNPLPPLNNAAAAWDCYVRNWRPGKPRRDTWDAFYSQALGAIT